MDSPKSPKTVIRVNWATFLDVSHNIETITSFGISDGVMMIVLAMLMMITMHVMMMKSAICAVAHSLAGDG